MFERGETRSSGNSRKSNSNRLTSDDEAIYSAACHAQSNDGQIYIEIGKLNGWPVKVLCDTGCTGMIVDRALIPDSIVIPDSSSSLQMVDHSLINLPLGNVYQDDNQGGDMPSWMFKEEFNRGKTKKRDSKKKPAQIKKNDNCATQDVKVQEGTTVGKCVAGPVMTRAQAKKSNKMHPLKVEEAMSSVDKSTIEDLQKKDSTLKKCFDRVGKPIIRENYVGEFFMKNGLLYLKHQGTKTERSSNQSDFDNRLCL